MRDNACRAHRDNPRPRYRGVPDNSVECVLCRRLREVPVQQLGSDLLALLKGLRSQTQPRNWTSYRTYCLNHESRVCKWCVTRLLKKVVRYSLSEEKTSIKASLCFLTTPHHEKGERGCVALGSSLIQFQAAQHSPRGVSSVRWRCDTATQAHALVVARDAQNSLSGFDIAVQSCSRVGKGVICTLGRDRFRGVRAYVAARSIVRSE
ncbi:hypothetical protein LIA77_02390 [Sarocladium implicatum]|nr:hypothetical protein LIA77_02390 [Sarocladium implicatum]